MRPGSRRPRGWRSSWWWSLAHCWGTPCRMRWTLGRRELLEYGLVELVAPIERNLPVGNSVLAEPPRDPVDDLRRDELVRPAVHKRQTGRPESSRGGLEREVHVGRELAAPQREAIDPGLPHGRPTADGRGSLGIPQCVHGYRAAIEESEHIGVHGIEVLHVVVDLAQSILTGHPARADAPLRGTLAQIEAGQPLRRHEVAPPVVEHAQLLQETCGELAVPVTHEPDFARLPTTEREVPRHARDCEAMLLHHHVTRMVTISCGPASNRTVLPRPSSTRATDSRSSARTRWALFTLSPNRHAPAAFRPVAL